MTFPDSKKNVMLSLSKHLYRFVECYRTKR